MQALNDKGITNLPPEQTITYGKQICQDLYKGVKRDAEVGSFRDANAQSNPFLASRADDFVNASIKSYCPQFAP